MQWKRFFCVLRVEISKKFSENRQFCKKFTNIYELRKKISYMVNFNAWCWFKAKNQSQRQKRNENFEICLFGQIWVLEILLFCKSNFLVILPFTKNFRSSPLRHLWTRFLCILLHFSDICVIPWYILANNWIYNQNTHFLL